ncbi:MAG: hypothetical protein ABIB71_01650 [Candidatus Woesearchaeota archaeon]
MGPLDELSLVDRIVELKEICGDEDLSEEALEKINGKLADNRYVSKYMKEFLWEKAFDEYNVSRYVSSKGELKPKKHRRCQYEKYRQLAKEKLIPAFKKMEGQSRKCYYPISWRGSRYYRDRSDDICEEKRPEEAAASLLGELEEEARENMREELLSKHFQNKVTKYLLSKECGLFKKSRDCMYKIIKKKAERIAREQMADLGINFSIIDRQPSYVWNMEKEGGIVLDPFRIKGECINDYLDYCDSKAKKEKDRKKVNLAREVFSKKGVICLEDYIRYLSKNTREKVLKGFSGNFSVDKEDEIKVLEEIVLEEMGIMLQSKEICNKGRALQLVLEKWKPEAYLSGLKDNRYEISVSKSPKKVGKAIDKSESCIACSDDQDYISMVSDPATVFLVGKQNNRLKGYARLFLMKDNNNESVLAIDTIEPPGKEFKRYTGLVNIMALAAVQLGLEIGVKYVYGKDPRINAGSKEGFGKTRKNVKLKKLGVISEEITYFEFGAEFEGKAYLLMQNWKAI